MSKKSKYFSATVAGISFLLVSGQLSAEDFTITLPTESNISFTHYFHQGKYNSAEGEFKMSQNNMHDETLWEKTKEMSAKAWEATKEGTAKAWDKTKELSSDAWDKTKEVSEDAWDSTKKGASKAGDAVSDTSEEAWEATKEGSAKAWDKTKEVSEDAWDATKEAADDAKDAITDDGHDNPMYNPARKTSNTYHQQHRSDN